MVLIVYSTTKFLSGHGNAIGGAVVDMGNFEWDKGRDFSKLTKPDTSYHDINFMKLLVIMHLLIMSCMRNERFSTTMAPQRISNSNWFETPYE